MHADPISHALQRAFAPTGVLRASLNLGNPVLAGRGADGHPEGISVDLARALATSLQLPLQLLPLDTAAQSVQAVTDGAADVGFFAIDPRRGEHIVFTAPYLLIEGSFAVPEDSPLRSNDEVDRPGHTVTVGQGSAYDLHLSRELRHARIERAPSSPEVIAHFLAHGHDVAAGVRPQLEHIAREIGGVRLLPGHFMLIRQAMGVQRNRGADVAQFLSKFVESAKTTGLIETSMRHHGITAASPAPALG